MTKTCAKCDTEKPLGRFHRQGEGKRHSWCKPCYNEWNRKRRKKRPKSYWRRRNFIQRYGMTKEEADDMLADQGGCAICGEDPDRPCVDHDHDTGEVRGVLCHGCNIRLASLEDEGYRTAAMAYLGLG